MAIELSSLPFTNSADIVPSSGTEEIINTGIANTLAGNDSITGTGDSRGIFNESNGTINTDTGNDKITGKSGSYGIYNAGTIETGVGEDIITGTGRTGIFTQGFYGAIGTINTDNGDDTIIGNGSDYGIYNTSTINTGKGSDMIAGNGGSFGIFNDGTIVTDTGNDTITGIGTGNGIAYGTINTGNGNDTIIGTSTVDQGPYTQGGIVNVNINTGSGNDTIIGKNNSTAAAPGISNNDSIIDTGAGNDIVDALTGGFAGSGIILLKDGNDTIKGFGSGRFDGGSGKDTLELTTGNYTVGISEATVSFTRDGITMNTSEFEQLIAGSTTYNFTSLTNGQTITIV